ncbi:MAG: response regulator transcription factor [Ruminiclostridium sp.]|nr:response regulator transcription factor [Ruminiclostridium sp.]
MYSFENSVILVVDDDRDIVNAIAKLLTGEGYRVLKAYNGLEALETITENEVQLIIIDVMMPKLDGLSAMMKIRETKNIPIIVLSAKSEDSDKILGLSMGADDYITKPYNPLELVARVSANLRRYLSLGSAGNAVSDENTVVTGGLKLNTKDKQLYVDGEAVKLTATEYKITELLMRNAGRVFSAEEIYDRVWNDDECYAVENTVMVHIRHIREKIEINPSEPRYLKVVWGIGYKIEKINGGK